MKKISIITKISDTANEMQKPKSLNNIRQNLQRGHSK